MEESPPWNQNCKQMIQPWLCQIFFQTTGVAGPLSTITTHKASWASGGRHARDPGGLGDVVKAEGIQAESWTLDRAP